MIAMIGYEYGQGNDLVIKVRPCPSCGKPHEVTVNICAFENWVDGILPIQDAFPELSPAERELLLTGIDGDCFKNMRRNHETRLRLRFRNSPYRQKAAER